MKHLTPLKAIRAKCLECAGRRKAVRNCEEANCPLFAFRFGKNPKRRGIGAPESFLFKTSHSIASFEVKRGIVEADGIRI